MTSTTKLYLPTRMHTMHIYAHIHTLAHTYLSSSSHPMDLDRL
jgi:hypothetical protein